MSTVVRVRPSLKLLFQSMVSATLMAGFVVHFFGIPAGLVTAAVVILFILLVCYSNKLRFDGKRIHRLGPTARLSTLNGRTDTALRARDVERVETTVYRVLQYRGRVFYRYETLIYGRDREFRLTSASGGYRQFLADVLPHVPHEALDLRTRELLDHFSDLSTIRLNAKAAGIPDPEVLEGSSLTDFDVDSRPAHSYAFASLDKASELGRLGYQLKSAGLLLPSIEAFRRALKINSGDPRLLFGLSRSLRSKAAADRDEVAGRRANALLRLCERRAVSDEELLSNVGESYFLSGEFKRAQKLFTKLSESGNSRFRAFRWLGEIALREGKIGYAILHFDAAEKATARAPMKRWAREETEYFSRLNEDDEYLEMELARVGLLSKIALAGATAFKAQRLGIVLVAAGAAIEEPLIISVGWAVGLVSASLWVVASVTAPHFTKRLPYQLFGDK